MDNIILFDKEHRTLGNHGRSAFSDILYIPNGKVALLSLYNMIKELRVEKDENTGKTFIRSDDCVIVHKISLGQTGDVARKIECGERVDLTGELRNLLLNRRLFHEPVYQNGAAWAINPCNNFALLTVPGFYMLELFDVNQFDTAFVEYSLMNAADSVAIPDEFKLGSKK